MNGLLALNKYREKLNEGSCECNLCKFLLSTELNAISLRIWASQLNPTFAVHGRHEDAEEFLRVLIEKCANLSNLVHFDTKERHICTVRTRVSESEEINRDIKRCLIDIDCIHENTADMVQRTNPLDKLCSVFKTMDSENGVSHNVTETYTRLLQIHVVSAKRFSQNREKVTKRVYPHLS